MKRIISIILAALMIATIIPTSFAAETKTTPKVYFDFYTSFEEMPGSEDSYSDCETWAKNCGFTIKDDDKDGKSWYSDWNYMSYTGQQCAMSTVTEDSKQDNWLISKSQGKAYSQTSLQWCEGIADFDEVYTSYKVYIYASTDSMEVYNLTVTPDVYDFKTKASYCSFERRSIDLSKYNGKYFRFAFRHTGASTASMLCIDDVFVVETQKKVSVQMGHNFTESMIYYNNTQWDDVNNGDSSARWEQNKEKGYYSSMSYEYPSYYKCDAWLYSCKFYVTEDMRFEWCARNGSIADHEYDNYEVCIIPDGSTDMTKAVVLGTYKAYMNSSWEEVNIGSYKGKTVRMAFHHIDSPNGRELRLVTGAYAYSVYEDSHISSFDVTGVTEPVINETLVADTPRILNSNLEITDTQWIRTKTTIQDYEVTSGKAEAGYNYGILLTVKAGIGYDFNLNSDAQSIVWDNSVAVTVNGNNAMTDCTAKEIKVAYLFGVLEDTPDIPPEGYILYEDFENALTSDWYVTGWKQAIDNSRVPTYEGRGSLVSYSYNEDTNTPIHASSGLTSPTFVPTSTSTLSWYDIAVNSHYLGDEYSVTVHDSTEEKTTRVFASTPAASWQQHEISLAPYAGHEICVSFEHYAYDQYGVAIDLITVKETGTLPQYTVTFVDWDEAVLKTEKVTQGESATAPADPVREGYKFIGWDTDFTNVQSNLTVKAMYADKDAVTHTVAFMDWDGTILKAQTVEHGKAATAPADPVREGYTFIGWDTDFTSVIADITVTAQYQQNATYALGDVTRDGAVNTGDAVLVLKNAAGMATFDAEQTALADVTRDGTVNTGDAVVILKFAAGMITEF